MVLLDAEYKLKCILKKCIDDGCDVDEVLELNKTVCNALDKMNEMCILLSEMREDLGVGLTWTHEDVVSMLENILERDTEND